MPLRRALRRVPRQLQAYSSFPIAIAKDVADFQEGEITVRFKGVRGRIDQGAGILFNVKPNGDYLTFSSTRCPSRCRGRSGCGRRPTATCSSTTTPLRR